jgi:hypothetical protein
MELVCVLLTSLAEGASKLALSRNSRIRIAISIEFIACKYLEADYLVSTTTYTPLHIGMCLK